MGSLFGVLLVGTTNEAIGYEKGNRYNSSLAESNEQLADAAVDLYATGKQLEMQNSRLMAETATYIE